MTDPHLPLGRFITPDVSDARLARQRAAITARIKARPRPRWLLALAPALCLAALLVLVLRSPWSRGGAPTAGTVVEAPAGSPLPITLLDGSRVTLDPETKLSLMTLLPNDIRLELDHGSVDLDVSHVEGRQFVVGAAGYEARVLGTRFSMSLRREGAGSSLEVRVVRGRVRVTRIGEPGDVRVLGAGETWSTALGGVAAAPSAAASGSPVDEVPSAATAPVDSAATAASPTAAASAPAAPSAPSGRVSPGPKELWAQAENARAARHFPEEASALNALRLRHRTDPRAGIAAFELGRLRQDTLGDPAGAAEAFADAIVLAPNGPFREDAEARRVEALDAAGRREACIEARAAFLARYPRGIHHERVSTRCAPR